MSDTNLDWTFDDIPGEDESGGIAPGAGRRLPAGEAGPAAARRRALPRWVLIAGPALAVALALGAFGVARQNWAALRAEVAAEVAYEDARALAQDVEAVLALQSPEDSVWLTEREALTALGLAAPLPAPNLLPTGAPPRVVGFEALDNGRFAATVVRQYADAAGQAYAFELSQRYQRLDSGAWARLPDDIGFQAVTSAFAGAYLTATFPTADLPWLNQALPQLDRVVAQACAHWQCPPGFRLRVVFGDRAYLGHQVLRPSRPAGAAYPVTFDLPPVTATYVGDHFYRLPSPHNAGYPHDARAAEALTRATSVQLVALVAAELAGGPRRTPDFYLDALIAREEVRQGLTAAPAVDLAPSDYLSPQALWFMTGQGDLAQVADALAPRQQALAFVDFVLAGQSLSAEAALLRGLRQAPNAAGWIEAGLGEAAGRRVVGLWRAAVLGPAPAGEASGLDGLVVVCGAEALVAHRSGFHRLSAHPQGQTVISASLAPDGQRLAALIAGRASYKLVVFDVFAGTQHPLPVARPGVVLGWQPDGTLLYLEVHPANGQSNVWRLMRLRQYDPAANTFATLTHEPVVLPWNERSLWSPDHRSLSLALYAGDETEGATPRLVVLSAGADAVAGFLALDASGYGPAFSPDGGRLAVISGDPFPQQTRHADWRLNLLDWRDNQLTTVLTSDEVGEGRYTEAGGLEWSPDGRWLSFIGVGSGTGPVAFVVPVEGGPARRLTGEGQVTGSVPLGFSADSRYLAILVYTGTLMTNVVEVFDLAAPPGTPPQRYLAHTAEWAPGGQRLVLGGPAGLVSVDPASGEGEWILDVNCAG